MGMFDRALKGVADSVKESVGTAPDMHAYAAQRGLTVHDASPVYGVTLGIDLEQVRNLLYGAR